MASPDRPPLTAEELQRLTVFLAERRRGIVHTPEYNDAMRILADRFRYDQEQKAWQ